MKKPSNEKGQIIVILAVAMVGLLAITALAVDGSMVYNDRRLDQSTADSAALAGAGAAAQILKDTRPDAFDCGNALAGSASTAAVNAAQTSAMEDGVDLATQDLTTGNGVQVICDVDALNMKYLDINTIVTTDTEMTFARIIGRETMRTTVRATARVYPKQPFAFGNGLVSLSKSCGNNVGGITFGGTSDAKVIDAGIFSNSCIKAQSSSTKVEVIGGDISYLTNCIGCSTADMSPTPVQAPQEMPEDLIDPPTCSNTAYTNAPSEGTINPGNYNGISAANKKTLILNPGLYCLKGDLKNGSQSILRGERVTLYFLSGDVTINQNDDGEVTLSAPDCEDESPDCGVPGAIRGMLMYFDKNYSATITLNGGATNYFAGTIYGPNSLYKINGNSSTDSFHAQIVGHYIEITGTGTLVMNLTGSEMYQKPSSIELFK